MVIILITVVPLVLIPGLYTLRLVELASRACTLLVSLKVMNCQLQRAITQIKKEKKYCSMYVKYSSND